MLDTCLDFLLTTDEETKVVLPLSGCGEATMYNWRTGEVRPMRCHRRGCDVCRRFLAIRIAEQIRVEDERAKAEDREGIKQRVIKESERRNTHKRIKKRGGVYRMIPQPDGEIVLFSDEDGKLLPEGEELIDYIDNLLERIPGNKKQSSSKGFGGSWQRVRFANKRKSWWKYGKTWQETKDSTAREADKIESERAELEREAESLGWLSEYTKSQVSQTDRRDYMKLYPLGERIERILE